MRLRFYQNNGSGRSSHGKVYEIGTAQNERGSAGGDIVVTYVVADVPK